MLKSLIKKASALKACNFVKKRPQHRCFPVTIVNILRLHILKIICKGLLFHCCNGSLLNGPKDSSSRVYVTALGFRVFKSASLVLNRVPSCVQKPEIYTFDESIKCLNWLYLVVLGAFRSF